jgi:hypothetical protein
MSNEPVVPPNSISPGEDVAVRVAAVERESHAVVAALGRARGIRLLLVVLVAGFVGVSVKAYYGLVQDFLKEEQINQLVKTAQKRLEAKAPELNRQVEEFVNHSAPKLSAAFAEQTKKDLPQFLQTAGKEREMLVQNLQARLEKRLQDHYKALVEKQAQILEAEFPEVQDPKQREAMLANITLAVDKASQKYFVDELKTELNRLYATWDDFPIAEIPGKDDARIEDEFIGNLLELAKLKFAQTHVPLTAGVQ